MTMEAVDWTRYTFTREQLAQYMSIFAEEGGISVITGEGGSTHLPTKNVTLPVGAFNAQDIAAHEATHIEETDQKAVALMRSTAERTVLNAIEDARMERKSFHNRPGLRRQYQINRVNHAIPVILEESYLVQSIKGFYLSAADYDFPLAAFKPKARKIIQRFVDEGLCAEVRAAKCTMDLVPVVPKVLALFEEEQQEPKGGDGEPCPEGDPSTDGEPSEGFNPLPDAVGKDGRPIPHTFPPESCEACKELDRQDREEMRANGQDPSEGDKPQEQQGGESEGDGGESSDTRDGVDYDADEARHMSEAASKMGAAPKPKPTSQPAKVNGADRVRGGPTVNRLMQQANRLQKTLEKMEQREKAETRKQEVLAPAAMQNQQAADRKGADDARASDMPSEAQRVADIEKVLQGPERSLGQIDLSKLFSPEASTGIGYLGGRIVLVDGRKAGIRYCAEAADTVDLQLRATVNYLSRQLTVFLQSQAHEGMRDRERIGRLDSTRAYQMGGARFDVYRNPPNPSQTRPLVVLTTDLSGSMGGGSTGTPKFHAMTATLLMAQALRRLNVPVEVHGFDQSSTGYGYGVRGGYGSLMYIFKTFADPMGKQGVGQIGQMLGYGGGGTPAGEALAFAWSRAVTRPEDRKIVIMVTDGSVPDNAQKIAKAIQKDGGIVIGVGIGVQLEHMGRTFSHALVVQQAQELPNRFARLLKKLVLTGEFNQQPSKTR